MILIMLPSKQKICYHNNIFLKVNKNNLINIYNNINNLFYSNN